MSYCPRLSSDGGAVRPRHPGGVGSVSCPEGPTLLSLSCDRGGARPHGRGGGRTCPGGGTAHARTASVVIIRTAGGVVDPNPAFALRSTTLVSARRSDAVSSDRERRGTDGRTAVRAWVWSSGWRDTEPVSGEGGGLVVTDPARLGARSAVPESRCRAARTLRACGWSSTRASTSSRRSPGAIRRARCGCPRRGFCSRPSPRTSSTAATSDWRIRWGGTRRKRRGCGDRACA